MPPSKLKHLADGRRDLFILHIDKIEPETGFNCREHFDTPEDDALYRYLLGGGAVPPVLGAKVGDKFILTDGERRWRQCQALREDHGDTLDDGSPAPWLMLQCLPDDRNQTAADRIVRMVAANNGKPLTMTEQGRAYARYRVAAGSASPTTEQMARKFGCTRTHIEDCLLLIEGACPDLAAAVAAGQISPTLAVKLIRRTDSLEDQAAAFDMARRNARDTKGATDHRITERHFEGHLESLKKPKKTPAPGPAPATTTPGAAYAYDSSQEGDYQVDPDPDEGDDADADETETALDPGQCPKCHAVRSTTDPGPDCWRCAKTEAVQPDDEGGSSSPHTTTVTKGKGTGASGDPQASPGAPAPATWEPPVTLDEQFFIHLVEKTKPLSNDRRQTFAYLRAHLAGEIRLHHLEQWIREGRIDP